MKSEIHPSHGPVVFRDRSAGSQLLTPLDDRRPAG